ncbi:MAG TPA: hypothetical protein VGL59_15050 [Polyangia bacterium]
MIGGDLSRRRDVARAVGSLAIDRSSQILDLLLEGLNLPLLCLGRGEQHAGIAIKIDQAAIPIDRRNTGAVFDDETQVATPGVWRPFVFIRRQSQAQGLRRDRPDVVV